MEVHNHTHTPRKKWTHYFWEFLMLFLAVFCGFLAENQREHFVERHRAKEFARALYGDIVNDTIALMKIQDDFINNSFYLDTLFDLITSPSVKEITGGELYYYSVMGLKNRQFSPTDATIQQLINSGSLRYFRNTELIKVIALYEQSLRASIRAEESSITILNELRKTQTRIYNFKLLGKINNWSLQGKHDSVLAYKKLNLPLLTYDPVLLAEFSNWAHLRRGNNIGGRVRSYNSILDISRKLIQLLKEEYHLK